ncbi:hypothetical protein AB834_02405 [PVC group bacterium (ex Bugula neritina AB1)]|nr:hypothetical protein AB834_02405 [PVC group bacterium (ex Bugula neritina AB1)]
MNKLIYAISYAHIFSEILLASEVIPDGKTQTHVKERMDGSLKIEIAPSKHNSQVSYNSYKKFDVTDKNVFIYNKNRHFRTIINEIFDTKESIFTAPVEVIGQKANLVMINPNGIKLENASFINTSKIAFIAGKLLNISKNSFKVKSDPNRTINIHKNGLKGNFDEINLIGEKINISGKLNNLNSSPKALISLLAGSNEVEFDLVGDIKNSSSWVKKDLVKKVEDSKDNIYAINISELGDLNASNIHMLVTQNGAGVKINGKLGSTIGNIILNMKGELLCQGAEMNINNNLIVNSGSFQSLTYNNKATHINAFGNKINIHTSKGSFINKGGKISLKGTNKQGFPNRNNELVIISKDQIVNESLNNTHLGRISSPNGTITFNSLKNIENLNGQIYANTHITLTSKEGNLLNHSAKKILPNEGKKVMSNHKVKKKRETITEFDIAYGDLEKSSELSTIVAEGNIHINTYNTINSGSNILSNQKNIRIHSNNLMNKANITGKVHFKKTKKIFKAYQEGNGSIQGHGGNISAKGKVNIQLSENFSMKGGSITADSDLFIKADNIKTEGLLLYKVESLLSKANRKLGVELFIENTQGNILSKKGKVDIHSKSPVIAKGCNLKGKTSTKIYPKAYITKPLSKKILTKKIFKP